MRKLVAGLVLALGLVGAASAESLVSTFGVRLYGVPVGRMVIAANTGGGSYAAKGQFHTSGLIGLLARVRFTMSARGRGAPLDPHPASYSEDLDTGYRTSAASVSFSAGDSRIDPLSALVAALTDRPAASGCGFEGRTYDGKRVMKVTIRESASSADGLTCDGQILRLSGYSEEDMAETTGFAFSLKFDRTDNRLVIRRGNVDTIHGKVTLVRQ